MRPAASMIELIFAIVVIGISVMSIPSMITQSSEAIITSSYQEAILAGTTKAGNILSSAWDRNQTDPVRNGGYAKAVSINNPSAQDAFDPPRSGHFSGDKRRRFYADASSAASPGDLGGGSSAYIDGHIGTGVTLVSSENNDSLGDYIREYQTATDVWYIGAGLSGGGSYATDSNISISLSDTNQSNPTNIKYIDIDVSSPDDPEVDINIFAFSTNIGQTQMLKKELY